ncbi:Williams Beuren syndrome chromosome region 22 protein, partial [Perkinsus olseni]
SKMTERAIELMMLSDDEPSLVLDVGVGSGISGGVLGDHGHFFVGLDISSAMLNVALEREVDESGDFLLGDMGQGFGFRPGSFDGCISISALQWLCNSDVKGHEPYRRLRKFFQDLFNCLKKGGRAVLQFYPESGEQVEMITSAAMRSGFGGGLVVDFPHSSKAKKHFLVLYAGFNGAVPQGLTGTAGGDALAEGGSAVRNSGRMNAKRGLRRRDQIHEGRAAVKSRSWIQEKKDRYRSQGRDVKHDSNPRLLSLAAREVVSGAKKAAAPRKGGTRMACKKAPKRKLSETEVALPRKPRKARKSPPPAPSKEVLTDKPEGPVTRRSNRSTACEPIRDRLVEICQTIGVMRLSSCEVPTRRSRRLTKAAVATRGDAGTRQLHLVHEVVSDYRKCLGYGLFMKDFPSCELKILFERSFFSGCSMHCASLCIFEEEVSKARPVVLGSCLYRYDSVARDAMILLFATADELKFKRSRTTFSCRGQGFGRLLDDVLCAWLREHRECRSVYVEMQDETVTKFWAKLGYDKLSSRIDLSQTTRGFEGTELARKKLGS